MFYLDSNEEAVRSRFNTLSLYLLIFFYLLLFYLLDDTFNNVWFGFPIALFTFLFIRFLIHRRRTGSAPAFYNNKSKAIKLAIYTAFCIFCFFSLHYGAHYPILSQKFLAANMTLTNFVEYSGDDIGTDDTYWSFQFSIDGINLLTDQTTQGENVVDWSKQYTGCGCGVEYGNWGDIAINPSQPFRYYTDRFGVDGVKLPTWNCLCFTEEDCNSKYIIPEDPTNSVYQLYFKINGDPKLALANKKCPPDDMNFIQINREDKGVPAHDEVLITFLFAFSSAMASSALFFSLGYIHLTENYGNRITFVVLISVATISLELSVMSIEDFQNNIMRRFVPFVISMTGSGYIYYILLTDDMKSIIKTQWRKMKRIFKDDGDSEKLIFKITWTIGKLIWCLIGFPWVVFSFVVLLWIKGRWKIFALKPFRLSEEKYNMIYQKKETKRKNQLLNIVTIIDAVLFRGGEGVFLLHLLTNKKAENPLVMTVALVFVLYEFSSCLYPLIKQALILRNVWVMLESLNPRYYNVAVVRKERALKLAEQLKEKKYSVDEAQELRNRNRNRSHMESVNP